MPPTTRTKKPSHQCNHAVAGLRVMHSRRVIWFDQLMQDTNRASIGRTRQRDIRIDKRTVSRDHCELRRVRGGRYELRDRGSTNGLHVSMSGPYGQYRPCKCVKLVVGMHVQLGEQVLVAVDGDGIAPILASTYSEFLRRAYQLYGSAMAAARHLGRRSQNVVLRMVNSVREKVTQ